MPHRKLKTADSSFPLPFVLLSVSVDWMTPITVGQGASFIQSADSNASLYQKYPHRQTQKEYLTSSLDILQPSQVDTQN